MAGLRQSAWRRCLTFAIWCVLLQSGCLAVKDVSTQLQQQHHQHAAGSSLASSRTSSSSSRCQRMSLRGAASGQRRSLLHLDAVDTADTASLAEAAKAAEMVTMYPVDGPSVQKYLAEAIKTGRPHEIPVWFVVVTDPEDPGSDLSQQQIEQQVQLLNRAYTTGLPDRRGEISEDAAAAGGPGALWRFKLMGVRYSSSSAPMCIGSKVEDQIKSVYHPQLVQETRSAGGADRTLIIYTSDLTSPACKGSVKGYKALFGWSNTPMELQYLKHRHQGFKDGVVLDYRYLYHSDSVANEAGAKSRRGASTGAQLVHEVGHWMGLLHTFVGGCSTNLANTDGVDDTPPEANPRSWGVDIGDASGGCPSDGDIRQTCPKQSEADPWDNYMSYNNLACAKRFTPGQQARMLFAFTSMRAATH